MNLPGDDFRVFHSSMFFGSGADQATAPPRIDIVGVGGSPSVEERSGLSFQEANDQKVAAGKYDRNGEIASAWSDGRYSDIWRHFNFEASGPAREAAYGRVYPATNPGLARIDDMVASPFGATASLLGRWLGASQNTQDALLATGGVLEGIGGGLVGIRTPGRVPGQNPLASRLRNPVTGRFIPDPQNPPSPYTFTDSQRRQAWRDLAQDPASSLTPAQRQEIEGRGWRGPQRVNQYGELETMELSHEPIPLRKGGTQVVPRWPDEHAAVDPFRRLKNRDHD